MIDALTLCNSCEAAPMDPDSPAGYCADCERDARANTEPKGEGMAKKFEIERTEPMKIEAGAVLHALRNHWGPNEIVEFMTKEDGSHPTTVEAIAWLETLDPHKLIVGGDEDGS